MITRYVMATLALSVFFTTLVGGTVSGASLEFIVLKALKAMGIFCGIGLIVGWAASSVVREYRAAQYVEVFGEPEDDVDVAVAAGPQNVIFFIGDGMGPEQVRAANYFNGGPLSFESFAHQGLLTTYAANNSVTDSAAAATALATGCKVDNGVISQARPTNSDYPVYGSELETLLEHFQARGKSTGLVTTTYLTHATPATFDHQEKAIRVIV